MAELVNKFSWSFSAAEDFEECRRRRYWAKYAMWGGWKTDAPPQQRAAYRLSKMQNGYSLLGNAVESAVIWVLRRSQDGTESTVEDAYQQIARPFLNRCWKESRDKLWKTDPKRNCCLHEHYYGGLADEQQKKWVDTLVAHTKRCISTFISSVLPRLHGVDKSWEIEVSTIETGDPESFTFDGVKIYAIPDYVYQAGDQCHIHDWKSGRPKESHKSQLALYGLWAHVKHSVPADNIHANIEYLSQDALESRTLCETDLEAVRSRIRASVSDMTEYLVDDDVQKNEPLPIEEWDLAESRNTCRLCNFYELCERELAEE